MFVAGLAQKPAAPRTRTDSVASDYHGYGGAARVAPAAVDGRPGSGEGDAAAAPMPERARETGRQEEEPVSPGNVPSPPSTARPPLESPSSGPPPNDPFAKLESNLRTAFTAFSGRPSVWKEGVRLDHPAAGDQVVAPGSRRGSKESTIAGRTEEKGRLFRILVVDKNFRIPARKVRPSVAGTSTSAHPPTSTTSPDPNLYPSITTSTTHSPLSPLTSTSPTYPDGIMNPAWIRKHEDLVPCVVVLFLRLDAGSALAAAGDHVDDDAVRVGKQQHKVDPVHTDILGTPQSSLSRRQSQSRKQVDEQLVLEISERRKKWADRVPGVKVTVVLMASKEMLDDPTLDTRLSAIRRQSGLDTKSSLYVLTPVAADDLDDFVQSLQQAVFPSAMDFYATHYRANRRKRAKLPGNPQAVPYPATAPQGVRPLNTQGWAARYDWKAGWWAEARGDVELAKRHYEDAWQALCYIFGLKDALPPRTKRWLEAKVLADCIAIKICRLAFYRNDPVSALSFFHQHLSKFGDFSVSWGIGKDSFEFWSWLSRQYRLFAELLDLVVAHGLAIHAPLPAYALPPASMSGGETNSADEVLVSAVKPLLVLQNPGYYYYTAGNCAVQRKVMFEKAIEGEVSMSATVSATVMTNEKKVDHTDIIVELYTKAYDHLQARQGKNRLALYIAYRIAETQGQGGQYDAAMTFLRKIAHVYEEEKWNPIVWSIRSLWYNCAQRTGTVDDAARLLLEMMAPYGSEPPEDPRQYQDDLDVLLKTTAPSSTEPIKVIQPRGNALVRIQGGFFQSETIVNVSTNFMVELDTPLDVQFEEIEFSSFRITFSNGKTCEVVHAQGDADHGRVLDLGEIGSQASPQETSLLFRRGEVKRFRGNVKPEEIGPLKITEAALILARNSWTIHLLNKQLEGDAPIYLDDVDAEIFPSTSVVPRPLKLDIQLQHETNAFISETIRVNINVTSSEDKAFTLFYEAEADQADIEILSDSQQRYRESLSRTEFGIISTGGTTTKEITLKYHDIGEHQLRITFFANLPDDPTDKVNTTYSITSTISISVPFVGDNNLRYEPSAKPPVPLLSSERLEPDFFDEICKAIFYTQIYQKTSVDLTIHNIEYTHIDSSNSRLSYTSLHPCEFPDDWEPGMQFGVYNRYDVALPIDEPPRQKDGPAGQFDISWSRKESKHSTIDHFIIPIPPIRYTPTETIQAVIHAPWSAKQHSSFQWSVEITNLHPITPASNLLIQTDVTEGFSWTGSRHVNVPMIVPFQQWRYTFSAIPMTAPGMHPLPRVRLLQAETEVPREITIRSNSQMNSEGAVEIMVRPL